MDDKSGFDDTVRQKLMDEIVPIHEKKAPCKITVVGAGMVGMACNISILLKVGTTGSVI